MAHSNEQTELKSTEEIVNMRRSFSWNKAFFTGDGFLDAEELSSMIEGDGDDVKVQLQKIEEVDSLEAKLFQEIEASTQKSTATSEKKESQAKKVSSSSSTPVKTVPPRSPPSSGGKKVKSPATRSTSSKPNKAKGDSPSKTSVGITTKNKVVPVNTHVSRTPPASPGSSGSSSSSTISASQWSKRSSSVPRKSLVSSEKPSTTNARRNDEWKTTMNKVGPVSTRMSRTPPASPGSSGSSSSSSTFSVNQRSKRSSSAPRRFSVNNEKPSPTNARRNNEWKTTTNKVGPVSIRMSRTPPASPGSSSSSTFSVNQRSKRSSSVPRRSSINNEKPSAINARRNDECKTKKNKVTPVNNNNTGVSRTSPSSPVSSSSTFSNNQRSKRSNSVPRRSSVNNEKPSEINARRNDEWKISKPTVVLIPKTQSNISLKIKPPPVLSHPSVLFNSSLSSKAQPPSESSPSAAPASSTCKVNQRSKPVGGSKSTLKKRPTGKLVAPKTETTSPNASKTGKLVAPKTVYTGLKPVSQKTTNPKASKKQSSAKAKAKSSSGVSRGAENIILVSPEVTDLKGKLNALKMEISMQKKMSHDESGKGESSSIYKMNNQTKSK